MKSMWSSYISKSVVFWLILFAIVPIYGQKEYGIRAGVDLSKLVRSNLQKGYQGFEIFGDLTLKDKTKIAVEIGSETFNTNESLEQNLLYNYQVSGEYLKLGLDWEIYQRKPGEKNQITAGARYVVASFDTAQGVTNFYDTAWVQRYGAFPNFSQKGPEHSGLSASYLEGVLGFKTHIAKQIYLGGSFRMGFLVSQKEPENFDNLWIPGFNKVTDGARFGFSYNYGISYYLPIKNNR